MASFDEISKNDFNLNIPRYVNVTEERADIDITNLLTNLSEIEIREEEVDLAINKQLANLGINLTNKSCSE